MYGPILSFNLLFLRSVLIKCASTALSSKLVSQQTDFFAKMSVDAVLSLDKLMPLDMIGIKQVPGGGLEESFLVTGMFSFFNMICIVLRISN